MYGPTRYLVWARRFYGRVPFDLATSGMPVVSGADVPAPADTTDPAGWGALKAAIARYNDVPESECIAALGASHAIWLAYASLLEPGDELLAEEPGYEPLIRAAEGMGAKVTGFPRRPENGWAIDVAEVRARITPRTKVIALTNLHNPSGVRTSDSVIRELGTLASEHGATLLVDEIYAPFDGLVDAGGVFRGSARKLGANVVVVSSLTKCFGLGNERIGWVLAPPEIIRRAEDVITATCGMLPLPHAHRALAALARIVPLAERARGLLGTKRERVAAWVAGRKDLAYTPPDAGLFGFVHVTGAGDLTPFIEASVDSHGVLVAAGTFFGRPSGFRLAWSIDEAKLDDGLARLGAALDARANT